MDDLTQDVLDKISKVCICRAIPKSTMKKVILAGADTLKKVQKATGAGSGQCGGKRCTPKILELLDKMNTPTGQAPRYPW